MMACGRVLAGLPFWLMNRNTPQMVSACFRGLFAWLSLGLEPRKGAEPGAVAVLQLMHSFFEEIVETKVLTLKCSRLNGMAQHFGSKKSVFVFDQVMFSSNCLAKIKHNCLVRLRPPSGTPSDGLLPRTGLCHHEWCQRTGPRGRKLVGPSWHFHHIGYIIIQKTYWERHSIYIEYIYIYNHRIHI